MRVEDGKLECGPAAHPDRFSLRANGEGSGEGSRRRQAHRAVSPKSAERRWGVVLAGGDGIRLRGLTRFICGDDRPKQFCRILGDRTLLEDARQRAERSVRPERILYSVTRAHHDYYARDLAGQALRRIVQPCNKGTAPAILYTLLHIFEMDPDAIVAILPSDHSFRHESVFTEALESAFAIAAADSKSVVLLGAQPSNAETEYGWIEVGAEVRPSHPEVFHVTGFHEKPGRPAAERLLRSGCLWNTFVMAGHVKAFLDMAEAVVPALVEALRAAPVFPTSDSEKRAADLFYRQIEPADFSRQVLAPAAKRLVALRLGNAGWNDLGDPDRVLSTLLERDSLPAWAMRWQAARQVDRREEPVASTAVA